MILQSYPILIAIVIFMGSFTSLIGQSPHELFRFDNSLRQLFPYDGKSLSLPNLKDLDEVIAFILNSLLNL